MGESVPLLTLANPQPERAMFLRIPYFQVPKLTNRARSPCLQVKYIPCHALWHTPVPLLFAYPLGESNPPSPTRTHAAGALLKKRGVSGTLGKLHTGAW